jgi:hypothetical protein
VPDLPCGNPDHTGTAFLILLLRECVFSLHAM